MMTSFVASNKLAHGAGGGSAAGELRAVRACALHDVRVTTGDELTTGGDAAGTRRHEWGLNE